MLKNGLKYEKAAVIILLVLLLGLLPSPGAFCEGEKKELYTGMPEYLVFHQETAEERLHKNVSSRLTLPVTVNEDVNAELREKLEEMHQSALHLLPGKNQTVFTELDTGAEVWRTGTSWMSFLLITRYSVPESVEYIDTESRVYDIETGKRITLGDVFPEGSPAWEILCASVRESLSAYWPEEAADAEKLEVLCSEEGLRNASFCLTAARLLLTFRADSLYEGKKTLMHVSVYYSKIRDYMTEEAYRQTDNSRFKKVALTFDDGPAAGYTRDVLNTLRYHGASGTFFVVGDRMKSYAGLLCREHDSGCSVQSHNYKHDYDWKENQLFSWRDRMEKEMSGIIGRGPSLIRAPGGKELAMINRDYGLPFIHWSLVSGDIGDDMHKVETIYKQVKDMVKNGDVVLMHDLNADCCRYLDKILTNLEGRGFLFCTVEELFADAGIPFEKNKVYYSTYYDYSK